MFTVYPALDVRDGRVVRLRQGDYAQETRYDVMPLARASEYAEAGARWLHLVDLDAARDGGNRLHDLVRQICRETCLKVQVGGGVRSLDDIKSLLDAGAERVVVGSVAVRAPDTVETWMSQLGAARVTVALDTRLDEAGVWRLPTHGWTAASEVTLFDMAERFSAAGLQHLLCTDIARDGMMAGPATDLYAALSARFPDLAVQASGGVRDLDDIDQVRQAGCGGAVLGKALLEGRIDLTKALAC